LKQVNAGPLNIGYAEDGLQRAGGHSAAWLAYDIIASSMSPPCCGKGYRVIIPYVRAMVRQNFSR